MTPSLADRRARLAVSAVFFVLGAALGSWAPHIATVQIGLGLSHDLLGRALFYASTEESAKALLEAGIDPTHCDHYGNTALESAFEDERREVAIALLKVSGDFERRQSGWTRLHTAAFRLQPFAVQVLIEAGADPFALTKDGQSALHLAAWQGDSSWDDDRNENIRQTIRLLVRAGLDPNLKSASGLTPLHDAAHGDWGSVPAIEELLLLGANPNTEGKTPLMEAAEHGELGCVGALLAGGADPHAKDRSGRTALAYARQHLRTWKGIVKGKTPVSACNPRL